MFLNASVCLVFYFIVFDIPVADMPMYLLSVLLGCVSFATSLTMVSGIASKAGNNFSLMAILSFPVVIPVQILLIKLSKNAMDGLDRSVSTNEVVLLRSEEHTSELQSLMRISYAVFCLKTQI